MPTFLCLCNGIANDFVLLGDVLRKRDGFIFRDRIFVGIFKPWIGDHHAISKGLARRLIQEERRLQIDRWQSTKHCKTQTFILAFVLCCRSSLSWNRLIQYTLPNPIPFSPTTSSSKLSLFFKYSYQNYAILFYHVCFTYFVNLFFRPPITVICVTRRFRDTYW
jgi:hypothetical protein